MQYVYTHLLAAQVDDTPNEAPMTEVTCSTTLQPPADLPGLTAQLTQKQTKVLLWIGRGWPAYRSAGEAVEINGKTMCTLPTMRVLERLGLAMEGTQKEWDATDLGRQVARHISDRMNARDT
jgi:hypothetical protein